MVYCGKNDFPMMFTVQRGRLPKGVPVKFMHKDKITPHKHRAKVVCFLEPIIMAKEYKEEKIKYTRVYGSFQSTCEINIQQK